MASRWVLCAAIGSSALMFTACEKEPAPAASTGSSADSDADHGHDHNDGGHHHDAAAASLALGEVSNDRWSFTAARDAGDIKAGGDAPIDVRFTKGVDQVAAVRFWIGAQDAVGSIKARAEHENPADTSHFHTHAEIPDPLPEGAKLWVEIEDTAGVKTVESFDLKV